MGLNGALVVGLGNPGPRYAGNRHNFGFMVLEKLLFRTGFVTWREKFSGQVARVQLEGVSCTLLQPLTYMNRSGRSVSRAAQFYQVGISNIVVVHDEVDLEYGTIRVKNGGGTAGHKGLASIKRELGDAGFLRVRMGVGRPVHGDVSDFVLSDFSPDERVVLEDLVQRGADAVSTLVTSGVTAAMNEFNRRDGGRNAT